MNGGVLIGLAVAIGAILVAGGIVLAWNRTLRRLADRRTVELERELQERRRTEAENARLATALEQAAEHVVVAGRTFEIEYVNPAFAEATGRKRSEIVGKPLHEIVRAVPDATGTLPWEGSAEGAIWRGNLEIEGVDGSRVSVEGAIAPIREDKSVRGYIATFRDRTQEEALEEQLRETNKLRAIGTLAGGIAHDFNNLLTPILASAEMAQRENRPLDAGEAFAQIRDAALRAKELIGQISIFGRTSKEDRERVDLGEVVEHALALLRGSLPSTITIETDFAEGVGPILGNVPQLQSAIMNLGTNAIHAMEPDGGILRIEIREQTTRPSDAEAHPDLGVGRYCVVQVSDDGSGMSQSVKTRIFEPYFTTKEEQKGTGLGLATVHGVVRNHGGAIRVRTEEGQGTVFELYFPVSPDETGPAEAVAELSNAEKGGGERILLVDDETAVLTVMKKMLRALGYAVVACAGAEPALDAFRTDPSGFDLVVTDFTMPGMTGEQLGILIRDVHPDQPIVIITGGTSVPTGIDAVILQKPIRMPELDAALRKALDGSQRAQSHRES